MPTKAFILNHRSDDPLTLALQAAKHPDVDMAYALEQISGWQRAKEKLPSWAACDDIIYPGRLALEQCSSEQTARLKADICQRLLGKHTQVPTIMADLTGGMGVDFSHLAPLFTKAFYIEQQQQLCLLARNNFKAIHISNAEVLEGDGIALLHQLPHLTLAYLDPARRDTHGARTFAIADCTPNIIEHLDTLLEKADMLMVKLSPMLDWHDTLRSLNDIAPNSVSEMHIVAVNNECKELLVILSKSHASPNATLCCTNDGQTLATDTATELQAGAPPYASHDEAFEAQWLYEPNAAIMRAGCFSTLARLYPVKAIAPNSHLFIANEHVENFPGRTMRITSTSTMNKSELRQATKDIRKANITTRNFPLTPNQLRQRLKLSDGGDNYIFGTTTSAGKHVIFICLK